MINYKEELANKLQELKEFDGFPLGNDEDILALSKPPFYTACPNPFIEDFIEDNKKPFIQDTDTYHCVPFVGDVSEGKNNPVYNAHSYHTKVPHKAIVKYIEHYTNEGDIVLDNFCGTGMTGIAAQLINKKAILSDISPIASFIAYNFNHSIVIDEFEAEAKKILTEVSEECSWLYETNHVGSQSTPNQITIDNKNTTNKGTINFVLWSDLFDCPYCHSSFAFYDLAVDHELQMIKDEFQCQSCRALLKKDGCKRKVFTFYDDVLGKEVTQTRQVPVIINYSVKVSEKGKWKTKRFEKKVDKEDLDLIQKVDELKIPYWFPSDKFMRSVSECWGDAWRAGVHFGISNVHHFYTKVNLWVMACYWNKCLKLKSRVGHALLLSHSAANLTLSKMRRFRPDKKGGGPLSGTMYISSLFTPPNVILSIGRNINFIKQGFADIKLTNNNFRVQVASATKNCIPKDSIDYIFTDPPFGDNLMYSELNFIWEAWLKVYTNISEEAIINQTQQKGLEEYNGLMLKSFKEYYRVLKPKRWITVVFHNSSSKVWNGIQEAITKAGFIIAQVSVLDKKQGSFKQVTAPGSVSNDLVISAYKPEKNFEENFLKSVGKGLEADYIHQFLHQLPNTPSIERTEKMLFSKMLSFYIQHGFQINLDAKAFYQMLKTYFVDEDGFWFTANQVNSYLEYKKQVRLEGIDVIKFGTLYLFISDEKSSLVWLYNFINSPKSFSDISTAFNQLATIQNDNVPELWEILEQNFIFENEKFRRPKSDDEHSQLTDKRERSLQREFESLLIKTKSEKGKIKVVRKEAVMYGFEMCYKSKRFNDILIVAKKLDKSILENSAEINDFVEAAEIMVQGVA